MTVYKVLANGVHGPYEGLNAVADELVDQWFTRPGPDFFVVAEDNGRERPLREHEAEVIVRRLVQIGHEHRQPFFFDFTEEYARAAH